MKLKICGLRDERNIMDILGLNPDFLGFIFYEKSSRYARRQLDPYFTRDLSEVDTVGVFVNEDLYQMEDLVDLYGLDFVQLHGQESPQICEDLKNSGVSVIKVFSVGEDFDFGQLEPYEGVVDYFLFDTKGKLPGGNGVTFNWQLMTAYTSSTPYFLSGGIGPEHRGELLDLELPGLEVIDINSRFEVKPGLKDVGKLQDFWPLH